MATMPTAISGMEFATPTAGELRALMLFDEIANSSPAAITIGGAGAACGAVGTILASLIKRRADMARLVDDKIRLLLENGRHWLTEIRSKATTTSGNRPIRPSKPSSSAK